MRSEPALSGMMKSFTPPPGGQFLVDTPFLVVGMLLMLLAIGVLLWHFRCERLPFARYSHLGSFSGVGRTLRVRLAPLPNYCKLLSMGLFLIAMANPRWQIPLSSEPVSQEPMESQEEEVILPREGLALYFVLDRSGSMRQEMDSPYKEGRRRVSRMDVLRTLTRDFIVGDSEANLAGRYSDMIGLVGFARVAQVLTPLTLDHQSLLEQLEQLSVVRYRQEDGTAIGYALFKTINLIAATQRFSTTLEESQSAYSIRNSVVILITDGGQNPHPLDLQHPLRSMGLEEAARYAAEEGVKVYIINVEPAVRRPLNRLHMESQKAAAESTGGRYYIADNGASLPEIYAEIDRLERSPLPQPLRLRGRLPEKPPHRPAWQEQSLVPPLVASGLTFLLLGLLLESTWLRRVP